MPLQGAIVVCYGGGRVTANFGGVRGAIAGSHCSVLEGDDQLLGSGRGAIAGCHCSVLWLGGGHFFFTLITQKLVFAIWVYAGIICLFLNDCIMNSAGSCVLTLFSKQYSIATPCQVFF